jgi:hypothetical protein
MNAHLLSPASQWLLYLDGELDWQTRGVPLVGQGERKK